MLYNYLIHGVVKHCWAVSYFSPSPVHFFLEGGCLCLGCPERGGY